MRQAVLILVTLVALVGLARVSAAQPSMTPPSQMAPMTPMAPAQPSEPLSENVALGLSLGGTVASYGLLFGAGIEGYSATAELLGLGGVLLAPSFGHWYAGKFFTRGLALRAAGLGTLVLGAIASLDACPLSFSHDTADDPCEDSSLGTGLLIAGLGIFAWGTLDDIVTAPRRVRAKNAASREAQLTVMPTLRHDGGGFAVAGRF
jgi:hypothetical protein